MDRTTVTTPDGNMVSFVIQIGDCNAPATYQALMNHLFSEYIGRFMDVYLDDIVIFSMTLEDHIRDCKEVIDHLYKNKFFISSNKLQFLANDFKLLGHVIKDGGVALDPAKVDCIEHWKVPTSKKLLMEFLGVVGFLAPGVPTIRIPMGILFRRAGKTSEWH